MNFDKKTITVISVILFILILVLTNPDTDTHRDKIKSKALESTEFASSEMTLGKALALPLFERVVDNYVDRMNFILFSLTEIKIAGENKIVGIGILGNVFIFKQLGDLSNDGHSQSNDKLEVVKKSGVELYNEKCSLCHGNDGKLNLGGATDLTISKATSDEIFDIIKNGKNAMPSYNSVLTDEEIKDISEYVKTAISK